MPLWGGLVRRRRTGNSAAERSRLTGVPTADAENISRFLGNPPDLVTRRYEDLSSGSVVALYLSTMIDEESVRRFVLLPLTEDDGSLFGSTAEPDSVAIPTGRVKSEQLIERVTEAVLRGQVALLKRGDRAALLVAVKGPPTRALGESSLNRTTRGPRVAFTEDLDTNVSLLRRSLPDPQMRLDEITVGRRTKTRVAIAYVDDIAKPEVVRTIKGRISRIDIDGVFASGLIEQMIEDHPFSLFPQMIGTELPSKAASGLLEGRVAIIADGTPFVIVGPAVFASFLQAQEDYNERVWIGNLYAVLRYASLLISLTLPPLYVAMSTYNPELLPLKIATAIALARSGVPFPPIIEALLFELVIDLIREMGLRLPSPLGQTVGVVGGIVLGEASIRAGLVSPAMLVVVVLTTISTYATPIYTMAQSQRIVRVPLMLLSAVFGIYGLTLGLLAVLAHLCSLEAFGIPYLSPFAPLRYRDLKDTIIRVPWWMMRSRPSATSRASESDRQDGDYDQIHQQ
ncbi:MAG: spore germination protein [Bacillota bacterium]